MSTARLILMVLVVIGCATSRPGRAAVTGRGGECAAAAAQAERDWALPPDLLLAIGLAETGQRDPVTGLLQPVAASVNIGGADVVFASTAYAVGAVTELRGHGIDTMDVGCFQINLRAHPLAFASVPEAFDPRSNANYAGRFLHRLFERTGSWEAAVAAYHSADPVLGGPYRDRVLRFWRDLGHTRMAIAPAEPPPPSGRSDRHVIRLSAAAASIPVYTPATLPASLRIRLTALTQR